MTELEGRRIVVTGAAGSLGAAAVADFARRGARVAALDSDAEAARKAAAEAAPGVVAATDSYDASGRDIGAAVERASAELGRLDALVHLVDAGQGALPEDLPSSAWTEVFKPCLRALREANQAAFRVMGPGGGGRIVNLAHPAGVQPQPGESLRAAIGGGVLVWSRIAAMSWQRHGILVNNLVADPAADPERGALPLLRFLVGADAAVTGQDFRC